MKENGCGGDTKIENWNLRLDGPLRSYFYLWVALFTHKRLKTRTHG